ncbi:MAG TPA: efflux RND transporter periplasmic adaptor subunit, partial [Bryobacteraceae bacterium]|nr:efflux RND transporter periplasmic adaptor subunit [Bryobacteraceae bacterium]
EYHRERSHSTLTAPFAGIVTQLSAAPGETADTDNELMTVADLSTVWVLGDGYEKDIHAVREGRQAEVVIAAYPERTFTGTITYVSDMLDPSTRTAKVRVEVPNPEDLLKVEMFATVRIPGAAVREVLAVPDDALQQVGGDTVVFVRTGDGLFEKRALKLGDRNGGWVEVTGGLAAGEMVVTDGSFLLKSEANKGALGNHEH